MRFGWGKLELLAGVLIAAALLAARAPAAAALPHNGPALTDTAAASLVARSGWEPRPDNYRANHTMPTQDQLAYFRAHDSLTYARYVTGHYTGTTDEIIQWAARKWRLSLRLMRAVAAVETWWHSSFVGDGGHAFGLYQLDERWHCCAALARGSTAFSADYYGAMIRSYYDGTETWLRGTPNERKPYRAGDLWDSVGYWASGGWDTPDGWRYVHLVWHYEAAQVWRGRWF
jgi:hypothetical protein